MNDNGWKEWMQDRSRPSYGSQAEIDPLAENFWGSGQRRIFIKALENRGFKGHEVAYVRTKGMPRSDAIIDKLIY